MNKQLMKSILEKARVEAMLNAHEDYKEKLARLMLKDVGDVYASSLDVLIVNQCREYADIVERIDENFDIATTLIDRQ